MTFDLSLLLLAWLAIVLLAFAMAGLYRQVQSLAQRGSDGAPTIGLVSGTQSPLGRPAASATGQLVLLADSQCDSCRVVLPNFGRVAESNRSIDFVVLSASPVDKSALPASVRVVQDSTAMAQFRAPWLPALAEVDRQGRIREVSLVGSPRRLDELVMRFVSGQEGAKK